MSRPTDDLRTLAARALLRCGTLAANDPRLPADLRAFLLEWPNCYFCRTRRNVLCYAPMWLRLSLATTGEERLVGCCFRPPCVAIFETLACSADGTLSTGLVRAAGLRVQLTYADVCEVVCAPGASGVIHFTHRRRRYKAEIKDGPDACAVVRDASDRTLGACTIYPSRPSGLLNLYTAAAEVRHHAKLVGMAEAQLWLADACGLLSPSDSIRRAPANVASNRRARARSRRYRANGAATRARLRAAKK